jgi:hypothetical protein
MITHSTSTPCPADAEVLADLLEDDLLQLKTGERLWKLYCFRSAQGQATQLRHRIYTKVKADGRLALVTFAAHTPVAGRRARSNIARVPDLPADTLARLIQAILAQTRTPTDAFEELDLSEFTTLAAQLDALRA